MGRAGERDPITRQRSEWRRIEDSATENNLAMMGSTEIEVCARRVHDGWLRAIVAREMGLLHASISWSPQTEKQGRNGRVRYPTWDELADARDELLPDDVEFRMILPKAGEYVAVHATTFHLHEHREAE